MRLRHLRQLAIRFEKALQRGGTCLDDFESTLQIAAHLRIDVRHLDSRKETSRNGFDGSKRVAQFVAEHPDESLPGLTLFFAKSAAHIGENDQCMRDAVLSKGTPTQEPAGLGLTDVQF